MRDKNLENIFGASKDLISEEYRTKEYSRFQYNLIKVIHKTSEHYFTFICGIITGVPISLFVNMVTSEIQQNWRIIDIISLILMTVAIIATCFTAVYAVKFTILNIKIKEENLPENKINGIFENIDYLSSLTKKIIISLSFGIGFCIIILFCKCFPQLQVPLINGGN